MKSEMIRISECARFKIRTVEVDANYIHLLVDAIPEISATQIVRKLKIRRFSGFHLDKKNQFRRFAICGHGC
jgi:REP element-mobilizing transposase RayT